MLLVADTVWVAQQRGRQTAGPAMSPQPLTLYCKQHLSTSEVFVTLRPIPLGLKTWECKVQKKLRAELFSIVLLLANTL